MELSVIVPARNEAACVAACLRSLVQQSDEIFRLGMDWELLVVDDDSTDATRTEVEQVEGVRILPARPRPKGWTGKANACWTGVEAAGGSWLLFTDADTVHTQGSLRRALHEAEKHGVKMLSYSPRQVVSGLMQNAVMPMVFGELAITYPMDRINQPDDPTVAANGQYLLIERAGYMAIGGHERVAGELLEDVALARLAKRAGLGLRFRYAADAASTRMYRSTAAMVEGWTKNLALLFGNTLMMAAMSLLTLVLLLGLPLLAVHYWWMPLPRYGLLLVWLHRLLGQVRRARRSNFSWNSCLLTPLGLPLWIYLLVSSWWSHTVAREVVWKGRHYRA